ncbi:MAG: DNA polymerase III subunit delta', partial [Lysobacterales bacterium]
RVGLEPNDRGGQRTEIVIDQVRTLCERLAQTSHAGGRRVALIDPADALNLSSGNALLKTLEEPPAAVVILLVADQPLRLLPTLRSRCQRLDVRIPDTGDALEWLGAQQIASVTARRALALAAGHPGEALTIARNEALVDKAVEDLLALRERRVAASEVAKRWSADELVKPRLDIVLQLLRVALAALAKTSESDDPRIRRLTAGLEVAQLSQRFDQLARLRARLSAPLRHELLLLDWLRQWMPAASNARRTQLGGN